MHNNRIRIHQTSYLLPFFGFCKSQGKSEIQNRLACMQSKNVTQLIILGRKEYSEVFIPSFIVFTSEVQCQMALLKNDDCLHNILLT